MIYIQKLVKNNIPGVGEIVDVVEAGVHVTLMIRTGDNRLRCNVPIERSLFSFLGCRGHVPLFAIGS